jgi:hypothetical protein
VDDKTRSPHARAVGEGADDKNQEPQRAGTGSDGVGSLGSGPCGMPPSGVMP